MTNLLGTEIREIREYTRTHSELFNAHHFLYDLPLAETMQAVEFVVMGINPGESERDHRIEPGPTEETSEHDFHEETRDQLRWTRQCRATLGTDQVVHAELFFWSSPNTTVRKQRFGPLRDNPHLPFCTRMNKRLIEVRQPKAVVFPGLQEIRTARSEYGLSHISTIRDTDKKNHRLVEHFHDGSRPWFFTKHWTGAWGFTNEQRTQIKDYIRTELDR